MKSGPATVAWLFAFAGLAAAASPAVPSDEIRELLDFTREYRVARAESLRIAVVDRLRADVAAVPPHARDTVARLADRTISLDLPVDDLALTGALLFDLAGEIDAADTLGRAELSAAASAVGQQCLYLLRTATNPWGLSPDSLRAAAERRPGPGAPRPDLLAAPVPPPYAQPGARVLVERGELRDLTPPGTTVDWFQWVPGRDEFLFRAGDRLYEGTPDGARTDLGEAGPAGSPPPSMSASAEYVIAADGYGGLRLLRRGVAGFPWRSFAPGPAVAAFAFSPARLEVALADGDGNIRVVDLESGAERTVAAGAVGVIALRWSPRGDALAWDVAGARGLERRAGAAATRAGAPPPMHPPGGDFTLLGEAPWAPDGVSWLAPARRGDREGLWLAGPGGLKLVAEMPLAADASVLTAPDFHLVAITAAPDPRPGPWGWDEETPFVWRVRPWSILTVEWPAPPGEPLVLDRPVDEVDDATWDHRSRRLIRDVFLAAERDSTPPGDDLHDGLWALDLQEGDDVPLMLAPGLYRRPRLSARGTWLLCLETESLDARAGRLLAREILVMAPNAREAERFHLRALPLLRKKETAVALGWLRDALRLDPNRADTREALVEAWLAAAADASSGAEAGLLVEAAVRELGRLYAGDPGHPTYGRDLSRAFTALTVLAGRSYAADAARRAQAFIEADPEGRASPERVRTILLPAAMDVSLWDPWASDARGLAESALRHYRVR